MLELGLSDIYKRYTWRKTKPLKQSRLDYFQLSDYLVSNFENADIVPGYHSDNLVLPLSFALEKKSNKIPFGNLTAHC